MKIHEYFTSVEGEIIRLVEYENKIEKLYNGWPASIETITGTSKSKKGFELKEAFKRFNLLKFKDGLNKECKRLKSLNILVSTANDPELLDIIEFLRSCQLIRVDFEFAGPDTTTIFYEKSSYGYSETYPNLLKKYKDILKCPQNFSVIVIIDYDIAVVQLNINNPSDGEIFRYNDADKFYAAFAANSGYS